MTIGVNMFEIIGKIIIYGGGGLLAIAAIFSLFIVIMMWANWK